MTSSKISKKAQAAKHHQHNWDEQSVFSASRPLAAVVRDQAAKGPKPNVVTFPSSRVVAPPEFKGNADRKSLIIEILRSATPASRADLSERSAPQDDPGDFIASKTAEIVSLLKSCGQRESANQGSTLTSDEQYVLDLFRSLDAQGRTELRLLLEVLRKSGGILNGKRRGSI